MKLSVPDPLRSATQKSCSGLWSAAIATEQITAKPTKKMIGIVAILKRCEKEKGTRVCEMKH